MSYEENVLIKLRRKYSKDEVVSALYAKISEKDLEIGKLISEIDFLNSELKKQNSEVEKIAVSRIQEHPMWFQQKNLIKKRGEEIKKLKEKNLELSRKNYLLTKKLQENDNRKKKRTLGRRII